MAFNPTSEKERSTDLAKGSRRKLIVGSCGVVLLAVLIGAGVWWWAIRGVEGQVANVAMVEEVTRSYVEALHDGKMGAAYDLLAKEVQSRRSQEEFASLLKADPLSEIVGKYKELEICEYQFGDKSFVTAIGLLHYEGGNIRFVSTLTEDSGGDWGIYEFYVDGG